MTTFSLKNMPSFCRGFSVSVHLWWKKSTYFCHKTIQLIPTPYCKMWNGFMCSTFTFVGVILYVLVEYSITSYILCYRGQIIVCVLYIVSPNGGREVGLGFRKLAPVLQTGRSCFVLVRWGHTTERRQVRGGDGGGIKQRATLRINFSLILTYSSRAGLVVVAAVYRFGQALFLSETRSELTKPCRFPSPPAAPHVISRHTSSITHWACSEPDSSDSYSDGKHHKCLENKTQSPIKHRPTFWSANGGVDPHHALSSHYFASNRDGISIATHNAVTIATDLEQSCFFFFFLKNYSSQ